MLASLLAAAAINVIDSMTSADFPSANASISQTRVSLASDGANGGRSVACISSGFKPEGRCRCHAVFQPVNGVLHARLKVTGLLLQRRHLNGELPRTRRHCRRGRILHDRFGRKEPRIFCLHQPEGSRSCGLRLHALRCGLHLQMELVALLLQRRNVSGEKVRAQPSFDGVAANRRRCSKLSAGSAQCSSLH